MALLITSLFCAFTLKAEGANTKTELLLDNVDYYIFNDAERHFLLSHPPLYKLSSVDRKKEISYTPEIELTLREIELRKLESETDKEFMERANSLYSVVVEHPEGFQEMARNLSVSRSRFRAGLLTPVTENQLDPEIMAKVINLEPSQISSPVRIRDSIFIYRKEGARFSARPGQ